MHFIRPVPEESISKRASRALGHSDLSTTLGIYGHQDQRDVESAMEAAGSKGAKIHAVARTGLALATPNATADVAMAPGPSALDARRRRAG